MKQEETIHYWSEPYKNKGQHNWKVDKIFKNTKKTAQVIDFHTEQLAWDFLTEIKVYINNKLQYVGV